MRYGITLLVFQIASLAQAQNSLVATTDSHSQPPMSMKSLYPSQDMAVSHLHGIAHPMRSSEMRCAVAGVVKQVHTIEGQWVKKGDLILTLNDSIAQARWRAAQAVAGNQSELKAAELQWQIARNRYERLGKAYAEKASSEFEMEERRAEVETARAGYEVARQKSIEAKANLDLATAELNQFHLRAPFDGQVVRIDKRLGNPVDTTEPAFTLIDSRQLEVEMFLPIKSFGTIRPGQHYTMNAQSPVNRQIEATARYVAPVVDSTSQTFRCVFVIENADRQLPAGFAVSLQ